MNWKIENINQKKIEVKNSLDTKLSNQTSAERLSYIQKTIQELTTEDSVEKRLDLFIYIMSALVHHERHGGLSPSQLKRLGKLAFTILQAQGINPRTSKLSFLYGELHLARSQIFRKSGDQWAAAWEQQIGYYNSKAAPVGGEGFQMLANGNRFLRLGMTAKALDFFENAQSQKLNNAQIFLARIAQIRAFRFSGNFKKAKDLAESSLTLNGITPEIRLELEWEAACSECISKQDFSDLSLMAKRKHTHHDASYIWESYLWAASTSSKQNLERSTKLKTYLRSKSVFPSHLGFFKECGLAIEHCYDLDIPVANRLENLGECLKNVDELINLDKVLLMWAASGRWLARVKAFKLASLCIEEYQGISFKLTEGENPDVFNLLGDLMEKPWFH